MGKPHKNNFVYIDEAMDLNQAVFKRVVEEVTTRAENKCTLTSNYNTCHKCCGKGSYPQSNGDMVFCFRCNGKGVLFL